MNITLNPNFVIPLLMLFSVIFIFSFGFYIAKLNSNSKCEDCDSNNNQSKTKNESPSKNLVTKKDMAYWIFIMILFIIFWVSSYTYKDIKFVEYISFSGTIVSIFLGIVAIIYSFFQTYDNTSTKGELSKLLDGLTQSSDTIINSVNKFSELENRIESILSATKDISDLVKSMNTDLGNKIDSVITLSKEDDDWETNDLG